MSLKAKHYDNKKYNNSNNNNNNNNNNIKMSDHQRSLLELKETQHQLTTALCPGKDKGMVFKNIIAHW